MRRPCSSRPIYAGLPPLQPTSIGVQPGANREGMIYPIASTSPQEAVNMGLGFQGQPPLLDHERSETLQDVFNNPGFVGPRYNTVPGYEPTGGHGLIKKDAEFALSQEREVVGSLPRLPTARRGPFKDHDQREKTARTRKIGSCIRCRIQRIRVRTRSFSPRRAVVRLRLMRQHVKISTRLPAPRLLG